MSFKNQNTEALHFIRRITLLLSFAYPQEEEEVEILNLEASTHNTMRTAGVVSKFEPFAFRRFYAKLHLIAELHIKIRF